MAETPETPRPLPTAPAPCWRCGGPSSRQGLRYDLCEACAAAIAEIARRYQGPGPAADETPEAGEA